VQLTTQAPARQAPRAQGVAVEQAVIASQLDCALHW